MPTKLADALADVQKFVAQLQRLLHGKCLQDYVDDEVLELAVKMDGVLIAEGLRRLSTVSKAEAERRMPQLPQIISFRNVIVHSYDIVDEEVAWDIVVSELPTLQLQVDLWAAELGIETPPEQAS